MIKITKKPFGHFPSFLWWVDVARVKFYQLLFDFPEQINNKIYGLVTGWLQLDFEESADWMSKERGLVKREYGLVYVFMSFSVLANEVAL